MNNEADLKKKLRVLMIVMVVIIIPGVTRIFDTGAFENVRAVDMAMLFAAGVATGALIVTAKIYLKLKTKK